jgi:sugar/nucleoside kinase (ribokinase family)
MPDFFLDRLISIDSDLEAFSRDLEHVARKKGGSIDGITQTELRGGNAINTASALTTLGVKVIPIVCTDKLGLQLIRFYLDSSKTDFSHIKIAREASITTAIETKTESGMANVMLRSVGSLADFGPDHLVNGDYEAMENADYVCVFNWAGTSHFGTKLAETVFQHVKKKGRGKTYCDTADPTPNKHDIPRLIRKVLQGRHLDVLSLNENEAVCYATRLAQDLKNKEKKMKLEDVAKESAKVLASRLSARIDLHTTEFSATFTRKDETVIRSFRVPTLRATGAGDAWNAGNILGDALQLSPECRLTLANAVAAYYISNPNGMHPSLRQVTDFCRKLEKRA